jgi:hypothetical protein
VNYIVKNLLFFCAIRKEVASNVVYRLRSMGAEHADCSEAMRRMRSLVVKACASLVRAGGLLTQRDVEPTRRRPAHTEGITTLRQAGNG